MGRHPSSQGLAVTSYELGYSQPTLEQLCIPDLVEMHHRYHSRAWYQPESDGYGAWRQIFRNLESHIDPLFTREHNRGFRGSIHDQYSPPRMPKDSLMIEVIEDELATSGVIFIHNHRRTEPPRIIPASQWQSITKRYKGNR